MRSYFLLSPDMSLVKKGSLIHCQRLGVKLIKEQRFSLLKIASARGGESVAKIIFDLDSGKQAKTRGKRAIKLKDLSSISLDERDST